MAEPTKEEFAPPPVVFIDIPHAPELFATGIAGLWLYEGNVHLTLEAARVNHAIDPGPINRVVIARLVIPVSSAQNLAVSLYDFLKQRRLDPVPKPADTPLQ